MVLSFLIIPPWPAPASVKVPCWEAKNMEKLVWGFCLICFPHPHPHPHIILYYKINVLNFFDFSKNHFVWMCFGILGGVIGEFLYNKLIFWISDSDSVYLTVYGNMVEQKMGIFLGHGVPNGPLTSLTWTSRMAAPRYWYWYCYRWLDL